MMKIRQKKSIKHTVGLLEKTTHLAILPIIYVIYGGDALMKSWSFLIKPKILEGLVVAAPLLLCGRRRKEIGVRTLLAKKFERNITIWMFLAVADNIPFLQTP